jgi:hypothetical protein
MGWEAERTDWAALGAGHGRAAEIPSLIEALAAETHEEAARRLISDIEFTMCPSQFLYESVLYAIPLLLDALPRSTDTSRKRILELLQEIACGDPDPYVPEERRGAFMERCFLEIGRGLSVLFSILESGSEDELENCVVVIANYVDHDPAVCDRALWYIDKIRLREIDPGLRALLDNGAKEIALTKARSSADPIS